MVCHVTPDEAATVAHCSSCALQILSHVTSDSSLIGALLAAAYLPGRADLGAELVARTAENRGEEKCDDAAEVHCVRHTSLLRPSREEGVADTWPPFRFFPDSAARKIGSLAGDLEKVADPFLLLLLLLLEKEAERDWWLLARDW